MKSATRAWRLLETRREEKEQLKFHSVSFTVIKLLMLLICYFFVENNILYNIKQKCYFYTFVLLAAARYSQRARRNIINIHCIYTQLHFFRLILTGLEGQVI